MFLAFSTAFAQDSDFVRAKKYLDQIENGCKYIKRGDAETYNNLVNKLSEAGTLLGQTQSKDHPDYNNQVNRWNTVKERLIAIPASWSQPQTANSEQQAASSEQRSASVAPASGGQGTPNTGGMNSSQLYESIIAKYQQQNRPALPQDPTPDQAVNWAIQLNNLIGNQLQQDTRTVEQALASGQMNKQDKDRFDRWARGTFYEQIKGQLAQAVQQFESRISVALERAEFIGNADMADPNRALNIGGDHYYPENVRTLQNGLDNLNVMRSLDDLLGTNKGGLRDQQLQKIADAQVRLEEFRAKNGVVKRELAAQPPKPKKKSTSQMLWLDGSLFCEITQKGEVWINSTYVGYIEANGKIWVRGNSVGSIEKNGKVWLRGSNVGSVEPNGEIWRSGSQVGTIEQNGKVWIGSSSRGTVEGPGDWRRAAVVYFFDFWK